MNRFVFSPSESRFYAIEWQADYVDNNCCRMMPLTLVTAFIMSFPALPLQVSNL